MDNHVASEHLRLLLAAGEDAEAARVLTEMFDVVPESAQLVLPVGVALLERSRADLAVGLADAALRVDIWNDTAHQLKIDALAEGGDIESSARAAEDWADVAPDHVDAQLALSWARLALFDDEGARAAARAARDIDPLEPTGWLAMAWVERLTKNWGPVARYCERAIELDPTNDDARMLLGEALIRTGRSDEGLATLSGTSSPRAEEVLQGYRTRGLALGAALTFALVMALAGLLSGSYVAASMPLLITAYFLRRRRVAPPRRPGESTSAMETAVVGHPAIVWGVVATAAFLLWRVLL